MAKHGTRAGTYRAASQQSKLRQQVVHGLGILQLFRHEGNEFGEGNLAVVVRVNLGHDAVEFVIVVAGNL